MPAIDLTRLKYQSAELVEYFDQPDAFLHLLVDIFEHYENRTIRISQVTQKSNLPTYSTPRPILHQIESDLEKLVDQNPLAAVTLTEALWKASIYETRLLSAFLLGTIPPASAMSLLTNLPDWLYESRDKNTNNALLTSALARVRKENPQILMMLVSEWLNAPGQKTQTWGLHAFIPLIQQLGFNDLPQILEILRPAIQDVSPSTQMDIQECINTLYSISPIETIHYLTEILRETKKPQFIRIFLRLSRGFTPELQKELNLINKNLSNPVAEIN